jgi:hypothetical protein
MHRYRGFYRDLDKSDDADDDNSEDAEQRGDLRKDGRYANLYWIPLGEGLGLGKSLLESPASGFDWSPVVQLGYDYSRLRAEQPLVPQDQMALYGEETTLQDATFESFIGSAGGGARYGQSNYSFTGMLLYGRSVQNQTMDIAADSSGGTRRERRLGTRMSFRMGVERLFERWVFGLSIMEDETSLELGKSRVESEVGGVILSAGTKFGSWR